MAAAPIFGLAFVLAAVAVGAQDFDEDEIPDSLERALLQQFSPVWYARKPDDRPPLPIEWYVRHCRLEWYDQEYNGRSSPGMRLGFVEAITLPFLVAYSYSPSVHYRLTFVHSDYRDGRDPADTITWARLQAENRGVYGRVYRAEGCPETYLVQYYLFFGMNSTDNPPCSSFGYHEGDVICVEFEVTADATGEFTILRSVYNNHGRKVFIDSPGALEYEQGRPVVYLETGTQEPLPWRGGCGFVPSEPIPPNVSTNMIFEGYEVLGWRFGAECEDFQVVREHWGEGPRLLVTNVTNLGERDRPGAGLEARLLDQYPGLLGHYAEDRVCYPFFFDCDCTGRIRSVTSPKLPRWQEKMWDRKGNDDPAADPRWPRSRDLASVHVNFSYRGAEWGTASQPFNTLIEGWSTIISGGTIQIAPGSTSERPLLCNPMTLTAPHGGVEIGR